MLRIFLTNSKYFFVILVAIALTPLFVAPTVASGTDVCSVKLDNQPSSQAAITEAGGVRFQTFVTQDEIGEQSAIVPPKRDIQVPPKTGKDFFKEANDPDTYRIVNIYVRATNCTNRAIRFGRFGTLYPIKLFYPDGKEIPSSGMSFSSAINLEAVGSVLVQPGSSINFRVIGTLIWSEESLTLILSRAEQRSREDFKWLYPGRSYQLQLTYANSTNQKPPQLNQVTIRNHKLEVTGPPLPVREVEVWKGEVTLPPVLFNFAAQEK